MSYIRMSHVTHVWVLSHIRMSHATHMNDSCHTYEWVMSYIWMSLVTHMNEPCHTYEWVMTHIWMNHVTHMDESCHTYEWVVSHTWHTWHISMSTCALAHSYVCHDSSICGSFICVPWLINEYLCWVFNMSHLRMSHGTHMNGSCHTYEWAIIESWHTYKRVMR